MSRTFFRVVAALLLCCLFSAVARAQPISSLGTITPTGGNIARSASDLAGDTLNATDLGVPTDGTSNASPALAAALTTLCASGNPTLLLGPYTYTLQTPLTVPCDGLTISGILGVTKLLAGASNGGTGGAQLLLAVARNNLTVQGVILDGGAGTVPTRAGVPSVKVTGSNIVLDRDTFQNTYGIGALFGDTTSYSGVRNSKFTNIGNLWKTEPLVTAVTNSDTPSGNVFSFASTTGIVVGRQVAYAPGGNCVPSNTLVTVVTSTTVTFGGAGLTCDIPNGSTISFIAPITDTAASLYFGSMNVIDNEYNFAQDNQFSNIGGDGIDILNQGHFLGRGNRLDLSGGWTPAASTLGVTVGMGCFYVLNDLSAGFTGNVCRFPSGNGFDVAGSNDIGISGVNIVTDAGGAAIAFVNGKGFTFDGNILLRSNQGISNPFPSIRTAGISFGWGAGVNTVSNGVVTGNVDGDDAGSPTQKYGIDMSSQTTLTNVVFGPNTYFGQTVGIASVSGGGYGTVPNIATGTSAFACPTGGNTATGLDATACGAGSSATGNFSIAIGNAVSSSGGSGVNLGNAASDHGLKGLDCYAAGDFLAVGDVEICHSVMHQSGTAAMRITSDAATANAGNVWNVLIGAMWSGQMSVLCRDLTTTTVLNNVTWSYPAVTMSRVSGGNFTLDGVSTPTPVTHGTGSTATISVTADTTAQGINITTTPPNADTWHCVATFGPGPWVQ